MFRFSNINRPGAAPAVTILLFAALFATVTLITAACSNTPAETDTNPPLPPDDVSPPESDAEWTYWDKHYLMVNDLTFYERSYEWSVEDLNVVVHYPQIGGLLDKTVQDKINTAIRETAEETALQAAAQKSAGGREATELYYQVTANYNHILCLRYYMYVSSPEGWFSGNDWWEVSHSFLFDLNSGRMLTMAELFAAGYDYLQPITAALKAEISRQNMEGVSLYRPLDSVSEDQPFYITAHSLVIEFEPGNAYFLNGEPVSFELPLHTFGENLAVYSRFWHPGEIFQNPKNNKQLLPGPVTFRRIQQEIYHQGLEIMVHSLELENIPNQDLQERLNRQFTAESVTFADDPELIQEARRLSSQNSHSFAHKVRSLNLSANFAGLICVVEDNYVFRSWENEETIKRRTHLFDINTGEPLTLADLFHEGIDYVSVINQYISGQIASEQRTAGRQPLPFAGISSETGFYLDGENFYFYNVFGENTPDEWRYFNAYVPFSSFQEDALTIF